MARSRNTYFHLVILATFILGHFIQSLIQTCTCSGKKLYLLSILGNFTFTRQMTKK